MDRSIIHLNVADFAAAVERVADPRLRDRPVIVAPKGAPRAVVHDMSEEAYQEGVRKGMTLDDAIRRCHNATVLPPHPERYRQVMKALVGEALAYSPLIEPGEADGHLFLDATGTGRLFGSPTDLARRLRKQARLRLGLDPIWSVAPNKLVAKVASRLVKPDGEVFVAGGEETAFMKPVPLYLIPGVYPDDLVRFRDFNLTRAAEAAALSLEALQIPFGRRAMGIYEAIRGIDPSPVRALGERTPVVAGIHDFADDTNQAPVLEGALYSLAETTGRRLRRQRMATGRLSVTLVFADGMRIARQRILTPPAATDLALFESARSALHRAWLRRTRVRRIRLACSRLAYPPAQLEVFPEDRQNTGQQRRLMASLDRIRERFGQGAVRIGRTLTADHP